MISTSCSILIAFLPGMGRDCNNYRELSICICWIQQHHKYKHMLKGTHFVPPKWSHALAHQSLCGTNVNACFIITLMILA